MSTNINKIEREIAFSYKKKVFKDEATGATNESKRPTETLKIQFPRIEDLLASSVQNLTSEDEAIRNTAQKSLSLLQAAVDDIIIGQARSVLDQDGITSTNFPYQQIEWDFIANLPPAQRRGGGIPKEVWEEFIKDYCAVMPAVTGKTQEQVDNASTLLSRRLSTVKNSKDHLKFFESQLALYMNNSPNAAEFVEVLEFLNSKIEEYLNLGSEDILKNL